jgi:3-oxoacyl-(acyl-carrier-protein) synthase
MEHLVPPASPHSKQAAQLHLLAAKSVVGHAEPAAGLLGLMYAVQQVGRRILTS